VNLSVALIVGITVYSGFAWLLLASAQVLDIVGSMFNARDATGRRAIGRLDRRRRREHFWTVPVAAAVGVLLAFGVDVAARLIFDQNQMLFGIVLLEGVALAALLAGVVAVHRIMRPEEPTYATIRTDIVDALDQRFSDDDIDGFRAQVSAVDVRVGYLRTYPQRTVTAFLWRRTWLRLVPVVVALVLPAGLWAAIVVTGTESVAWLVVVAFVPASLSYWLAWLGARASLISKRAWQAVYTVQRAEVEQLLAGARKNSKKRVAGLGDRVARALQILREQQS
jgi:hypothetical protein